MGCGCNKVNAVTAALGYKVVDAAGACRLSTGDACRVFSTAAAAARAARSAGLGSSWTVVPVRGM